MPIWKLKDTSFVDNHDLALKLLLANRDVENIEEFEKYTDLSDTQIKEFLGLEFTKSVLLGVKLIKNAILKDLPIVIHGDYDADGVTSTALLWQAIFEGLGYKNVYPYIPSRFDEGYGLSFESLESIKEKYFKDNKGLLITVDCGITAVEQVESAIKIGITVLITDHHQKAKQVPNADVLVWTDKLCGVGITYFLVKKLLKKSDFGLDLVAIGTVADLQPLTNINRVLVKKGLEVLNQGKRPGIKQLLKVVGFEKSVKAKDIAWIIAPRINAIGRLESALDALRLLCTKDLVLAMQYAQKLDNLNKERQEKTNQMIKLAEEQVTDDLISFISGENFHEGIVGLVAGRLTQKYYKPAIVMQIEKNIAKGSARSIPEINIIELLREFEDDFIKLGGHTAAAGFSIDLEKLDSLKSNINRSLQKINNGELFKSKIDVEFQIKLATFDEKLFNIVELLEPYGISNQSPLFLLKNLRVVDFKQIGRDSSHLSLNLTDGDIFIRGIAFGMAKFADNLNHDDRLDVVCSIIKNEWNGAINYEFQVKDLKHSDN